MQCILYYKKNAKKRSRVITSRNKSTIRKERELLDRIMCIRKFIHGYKFIQKNDMGHIYNNFYNVTIFFY